MLILGAKHWQNYKLTGCEILKGPQETTKPVPRAAAAYGRQLKIRIRLIRNVSKAHFSP